MQEDNKNIEFEIDIADIIGVFIKNIKIIIICAIIGGVIAGGITHFLISPEYKSMSKLYVVTDSNSAIDLSALQVSTSLTSDYMDLMTGDPFMKDIISELNLDTDVWSASSLRECITLENPENTRILKIYVTTEDPKVSADIANTLAEISKNELNNIMESAKPKIVQHAEPNYSHVSPSLSKNTVIGALLGLILSYAICMISFLVDDTIKSEEDIKRYLNLQVLATISDAPAANGNGSAYSYEDYGNRNYNVSDKSKEGLGHE